MPPPPKNRLHNKTGKLKTINRPTSVTPVPAAVRTNENGSSTDVAGPSGLASTTGTDEADRQFELELCWCIQTMETSLATGKLNAKQGKLA